MWRKLLVAGVLCASLALAQGGGQGGGRKGNSGPGSMGPMGPPPSDKFESIAKALDLSKDQRKAVRSILDDGAKEAVPLRDQLSKSRIAVGEAIGANKGVDELKQVAKTSSDLSAQLTELELKTFAKIFGALDDTQKKNMQSLGFVLSLMNDIYHTKNWNSL
jgi:Spy/CpxP family protein refolding chaperone